MSESNMVYSTDVEQQSIQEFTEKAYLDYSMYVILDRALPSVADGLKPVQRRIIFAMSELGLKSTAKFKKSARTVGDVLGKYHPHGDAACYEAMVLMAQNFSYRYPFVDGQGNWGCCDDPKSFAAMRYTESRLTPYAQALLSELQHGTVDWQPNFDATLSEPRLMPARVPNVLLNGAMGIAVGMSTDIPPHNLVEVVNACILLLEKPKSSLAAVMECIQGPDYPTGAEIITPVDEIKDIYTTGKGSLRLRATYSYDKGDVVVDSLPYQVSGAKILEQIAQQMRAKKLPRVVDLRDESDHENPIRLVIVLRSSRTDVEAVMGHLFAITDLERTYRVNMNVIGLDVRPQVKPLMPMLKEWLTYRIDTVKRRLQFRLEKVLDRLHILDSLLVAFLNIDEVIRIIRTEDEPKPVLMKKYKLSDIQTDAILDLKLRHLAKLEEIKIRGEQAELADEKLNLEKLLGSSSRLKSLVKKELLADSKLYGDVRRSQIVSRPEAKIIKEEERLPSESVTVIVSQKGLIRGAKGHEVDGATLSYRANDGFSFQVQGRTNQSILLFDSTGRAYSLSSRGLPSARSHGEPLTSKLKPEPGSRFVGAVMGKEAQQCVLASSAGYGFVAHLSVLQTKNKSGKAVLKCPAGAKMLMPALVADVSDQLLVAVSNQGRLICFPISELPSLDKGKGNKIIQIPTARLKSGDEWCCAMAVFSPSQSIKLISGKRFFTLLPKDWAHFVAERGRRGSLLPRGFRNVEQLLIID